MVLEEFPEAQEIFREQQKERLDEMEVVLKGGRSFSRAYFIARARWKTLVLHLLQVFHLFSRCLCVLEVCTCV